MEMTEVTGSAIAMAFWFREPKPRCQREEGEREMPRLLT